MSDQKRFCIGFHSAEQLQAEMAKNHRLLGMLGSTVTVHFPGKFSIRGELALLGPNLYTILTPGYIAWHGDEIVDISEGDLYLEGSLEVRDVWDD